MCFEYFGVFGRKNTLRYGLICGGFPVVGVSGYLIFLIIFNMCQPAGWIFEKNIKKDLHCIIKNAIKVSPFSCDTGCFHRTDDITNANSYVGYSLILDLIIYRKGEMCQDDFRIFI